MAFLLSQRKILSSLLSLWATACFLYLGIAGPARAQVPPGYSLVWSDEFNGPLGGQANGANWAYVTGANGWGNNELENYTADPANSQIVPDINATDGSSLAIMAQDPGGNNGQLGDYTSARMQTLGLQGFQYGYIEARIQMPYGQGIWPAFWMMGTNINTVSWPTCGELDILENIGKVSDQGTNHGSIHGPGYTGASYGGTYALPGGALYHNAYHTFSILWQPNQIAYEVDGNTYETFTPSNIGGNTWVFNESMFILLNMAVGGGYPGSPDGTTSFPQTMLVDYVRVYQANTPTPTGVWSTSTPTFSPTPSYSPTPTYTPGGADCPATLIDDFENQTLTGTLPARTNLWGGTWQTYESNATIGVTYNGPGAGGTNYSAGITGTVTSGSGYAGWQTPLHNSFAPFNAPAHGIDRVQFWIKGDGNLYRVNLLTQSVTDGDVYGAEFLPPAGVWTFYQVPFVDMARQGFGSQTGLPLHPSGSDATGIGFAIVGTPASYAFSVDQAAFACNLPTPTATNSPTITYTPTLTLTPTLTGTPTFTITPTATLTPTNTSSRTPTNTPTNTTTNSPTDSATNSPTLTPTPTITFTPTVTFSSTLTFTPTNSPTITWTPVFSFTPTSTFTNTLTFTPTSSFTPVPTSTSTITNTPTIANTPTLTPTSGSSVILVGPPYPNPAGHSSMVSFNVQAPGAATVAWDVFTTAFRKIATGSQALTDAGTVTWNLLDSGNNPAANGLYYIRLKINAGQFATTKVLKVLVFR